MGVIENEKKRLQKWVKSSKSVDGYKSFYQYQLQRLNDDKLGQPANLITLPEMPPGSPI